MWRRKQNVIQWEWDLQGFEEDEEARPGKHWSIIIPYLYNIFVIFLEFEASVKTYRINPVTREKEPYLPPWSKAFKFLITGSAVFFMVCAQLSELLIEQAFTVNGSP